VFKQRNISLTSLRKGSSFIFDLPIPVCVFSSSPLAPLSFSRAMSIGNVHISSGHENHWTESEGVSVKDMKNNELLISQPTVCGGAVAR
jgi:hypothetical protein